MIFKHKLFFSKNYLITYFIQFFWCVCMYVCKYLYMHNIGKLIWLCQDPPEMELQVVVSWPVGAGN